MPILKLFVGGGVPDAPADFAWLQFGVLDGIYDWFVGRGLDPSFAILLLLKVARGAGAWRRTTSAAIQQSWHARAVQCPSGALIAARPRNAAPYKRPHGGCRGEHCSPAKISRCRKSPGRIWNPPLRTTKKPQQRIETANHLIVECWPRAGASPSALGFLRARLRSVRAKREPKRP